MPPGGCPTLITPHAGELAHLLGSSREEVEADPLGAGWAASTRFEVTTLVKGWVTVVVPSPREAEQGAVPTVVDEGTPWLASAGAGDVLAGVAGALLATGCPPHAAAVVAATLHGRAARRLSRGGPLRIADLPPAVSEEVRTLAAGPAEDPGLGERDLA